MYDAGLRQRGGGSGAEALRHVAAEGRNQPAIFKPVHAVIQQSKDPVAAARLAVRNRPYDAQAWETLGALLAVQREFEESAHCFEKATQLDPGLASAFNNFAVALQNLGRQAEAEAPLRRAVQLSPESVEMQMNLANLLGAVGKHGEGLQVLVQIVGRNSWTVKSLLLASALYLGMGNLVEALTWVDRALAAMPDEAEILIQRAEIFKQLQCWVEAMVDCDRILSATPNDSRAHHLKSLALKGLNRSDEALQAFRLAQASDPRSAPIISDLAWLLAELGRKDEALIAFDQALAIQPDLSSALCHRAYLTGNPSDSDLATMARIANDANRPFQDRMNVSFALGQAYLRKGEGSQAFTYLNVGNGLKRATLQYDPDAEERRADEIIALFSKENLSRLAGSGNPSEQPIFVFGMPRSGTTLVEQILSSHSNVQGTGEPTYLWDLVEKSQLLARLPNVDATELSELGGRYLEMLGNDQSLRFVDKMTWNFLYAGLISAILPNARMIHCRRDPLDTCLSCYSLQFTHGQPYSYDLSELGRFYRLYQRVMSHWRNVLGPDRLLEVEYESLVGDTEGEVRRLLDFCGLPWDDCCLRFHETERRVTSASLDQVRTPIYKSSVGRAQAFRPWLGSLEAALADQE